MYRAVTKDVAEDELLNLEEKWVSKYPVVIEGWKRNWEQLSQNFQYTKPIRKIILYHKCRGRLPSPNQKNHQDQRCFHQ
ncbi:transposase [Autumnicola psychrophila]|uniref:Transposase n=1 Tax=Autumnicola psychrophila TaxID=3075592 RepID=A0ABU3DMS9_9FLAO|nr:transposase [Zunongwangia sp. F225]MDT0685015.1 transposase [Zunongwangia sp. F225]